MSNHHDTTKKLSWVLSGALSIIGLDCKCLERVCCYQYAFKASTTTIFQWLKINFP